MTAPAPEALLARIAALEFREKKLNDELVIQEARNAGTGAAVDWWKLGVVRLQRRVIALERVCREIQETTRDTAAHALATKVLERKAPR